MNDPPDLKPFMLRGLTYVDALNAAKATGCAIRRNHWCAPVVVWNGARAMLDDESELSPFTLAREDRGATDWEMTPHPDAEAADTSDGKEIPGGDQ